ncbi:hypothetical protein FOXG_19970 [Fusarium oxysporum f. sp. lycopersici 4287]|uniref:Peptidase A1 domain-containing protein n=2 Tax=Fusarium oxysporum TaxID=5507 RepID=A0A0J9VAN0_FUSO4|nr:hypothetical protein FOXG_19970 [Fusarium oxysporum f. sp. lycopersici 4287]EXK36910.1 hypothetical protein FOMG_07800 [Fusarium oxysporum f. sp. melonis 26406]KNB07996.1 hypothetical protein FOXG_19970 [Fusarium oxysporum f. sp. lycopersici 4287]
MGEMTLGGIDTSEYEGELKKVPFNETVVSLGGSWYQQPCELHQQDCHPSLEYATHLQSVAHLDPGTACIMAPDCETAKYKLEPELTFTVGSGDRLASSTMPKDAFNLGAPFSSRAMPDCHSSRPIPISDLAAVWILGIPVLKGYYTVWDGKNLELGVGQLMEEGREPAPKTSFTTTLAPCWALVANLFALIQLYHRNTGREDSNTCSIWWH